MNIPESAWIMRRACAMCGNSETEWERSISQFHLHRCQDCGFLQTARILDPASVGSLYANGYDGLRQRQGQEVNAVINMEAMRRLGLGERPGQTLLDIGCGYGFFLKRMRDRARLDVAGVELAEAQLRFATEDLGLNVARDPDDLPERFREGIDLMVCFEVIEHIANPVDFLCGYARRLRPGGTLVIATDNFRSLPVRAMGDAFPKWIPHQHISLFDPSTIENAVTRTGLLEISGRASITPWELLLRTLIYRSTFRRVGGRTFDIGLEMQSENDRPFAAFRARLAFNRFWFKLLSRPDLSGEMMFIAARRIA